MRTRRPQFDNAETKLTDSQQMWRERVIADCEAGSAGLMVAAAKQSRFMACDTTRTSDRAEALGRYVAALKAVQAAPGTKPPIAPTFSCPYTAADTCAPAMACAARLGKHRRKPPLAPPGKGGTMETSAITTRELSQESLLRNYREAGFTPVCCCAQRSRGCDA